MNLEILRTHDNRTSFLKRIIGKQSFVQPDALMKETPEDRWLYFNRVNPTKFEVYLNEDFIPDKRQTPEWITNLNSGKSLSSSIIAKPNYLLCLHLSTGWIEAIFFENQWILMPEFELLGWDHILRYEGRICE